MIAQTSARLLTEAGADAVTGPVVISEITDAAVWDGLLKLADIPQLTQTFAYGTAKAAKNWRVIRLCFSVGGLPVAVCQVLEKRVLGLRLLSRVNRGPIMLSGQPSDERVVAVYRALRARWGHWYSGPLLIAPGLATGEPNAKLLREAGYVCRKGRGWWSGRIDLTRSFDEILASFAPTFRNRLKKSVGSELTLRVASDTQTVDWMIERHIENMREKQFSAVDAQFLTALRATAPNDYIVFQAWHGDKPVAGMSVIRFGDTAEYHTGWFGPEGRDSNAGNFLMWSIMAEMKGRGCTDFDIGGLYEGHGYTQFKRGMRPAEYQLIGEWAAF